MTNIWQNLSPERRKEIAAKGVATRRANKEKIKAMQEEGARRYYGLADKIEELEIRLANLQTMEALQTLSCALTGRALLPAEDIVRASIPWQKSSGVYFLIENNEIIYVGQSTNVYTRIDYHVRDKSFDRYAYVPCPVEMLNKLESLYIHCLRPKLNSSVLGGDGQVKLAPIRLDELLGMSAQERSA
jgi:hypothetical protein